MIRIIGTILLSILLLLIFLLLILLFAPLSYRINGKKTETDLCAEGAFTFGRFLLKGEASVFQGSSQFSLRIFGIPVSSGRKKKERAEKPKQKKKKASPASGNGEDLSGKTEGGRKKGRKDRLSGLLDFLEEEENQNGIRILFHEFLLFLRRLRPKELFLSGVIGTGDPAVTGYLAGLLSCVYALYPDQLHLTFDFMEARLEGEGRISGTARLSFLLSLLLRIAVNQTARKAALKLFALVRRSDHGRQ